MHPKKVCVTGANGFLGSHLVEALIKKGESVHVLVRKTSDLKWIEGKNLHFHHGDITDPPEQLEKVFEGMDRVYHVAGIIRSLEQKRFHEVNVLGTRNVLEACQRLPKKPERIVMVTSVAAQGPSPNESPITETSHCTPITAYGESKRDAELISHPYQKHVSISIIRPPAIYGPRDTQVLDFFKMVQLGLVLLPGNGTSLLNLAHVEDVVQGILLAGEKKEACGETFLVGDQQNYSWKEACLVFSRVLRQSPPLCLPIPKPLICIAGAAGSGWEKLFRTQVPLNRDYAKNFIQNNWALDVSKIRNKLLYTPKFSLEDGVKQTYEWYQENNWMA